MAPDNDFSRVLLDSLTDGVYCVDLDRRITFWNKAAERITGYPSGEVMGRFCRDNILAHVSETGAGLCKDDLCPAALAMREGKDLQAEVYLRHRTGHMVPVFTRISPIRDAAGGIVGAVEVFSDNSATLRNKELIQQLERLAMTDALTGMPNRRYIEQMIQSRLAEMQRYGWVFGLLFMDIDHFKAINDTYGHDAGDEVLKMVSLTLMHSQRPFDTVGRWGGEEFVGVIANATAESLSLVADRFRALVERSAIVSGSTSLAVTISIGATLARPGDSMDSALKRADSHVYVSKQNGRNLVTVG